MLHAQEMTAALRDLFMRGGAAEGSSEHQQILAIITQSVQLYFCLICMS